MTRVLHVYKDYFPVLGGMENHIKMLSEALVQRGHEVTVLATHPTWRTHTETMNGVHVVKAGRLATVASTPLSLALPVHLSRQHPDIAHLHFPYPVGELSQLVCGRAPHTVITYHSDIVRQKGLLRLYRPLLWQVLKRASRIIATSANYVRSSPFLNKLSDKCTIIPLGIEVERFQHVDHKQAEAIRSQYGAPLLLFVGKLRYYKGLQYLLEAIPAIPAHLLVIGNGPMEEQWRALANSLSLEKKVYFLGQVSDNELPSYYQACDLFVLPACERSEAFGTVLLEAMASGLPLVSTELGTGTSAVNIHGETGLVVKARSPEALRQAVEDLLRNPSLRHEMGEEARRRALSEYSLQRMVDRTEALYAKVLNT